MKFIVAFAIFFLSSISVAKETSNVLIRNIADATTIKNKYISDKITNNGPLEAKNSTIHKLKVNGPVQAENLNSNKIKIDGSLQGKNVTSSQVQVQGPTILERTTIEELKVTGQAEVKDHSRITYIEACGHLKVEDSKVVHLKLDSNQCEIHNSEIGDLTFISNKQSPTLKLTGDSVVKGNITFKAGNGVVLLDKELIKNFDVKKVKGGIVKEIP